MPESSSVPMESIIRITNDQVSTELDDEAVILSLNDGIYYGLNSVAARVWTLLQEPRTVRDICVTLMNEYDVDRARCEEDLQALLIQLREWALIEVVNGTRPE